MISFFDAMNCQTGHCIIKMCFWNQIQLKKEIRVQNLEKIRKF